MMKHFREHKENIQLTIADGPIYKIESLPPNMISISNEIFVHITYYLGHVRVQIRRYTTIDLEGYLYPTHDSVALSPLTWIAFLKKIDKFKNKHHMLCIEPDLCIRYERSNGRSNYVFQHQFYTTSIRLNPDELLNLKDLLPTINMKFFEILFKQKLLYFYLSKTNKQIVDYLDSQVFSPEEAPDFTGIKELILYEYQFDDQTVDYTELQLLFQKHFKNALVEKMYEQSDNQMCFSDVLYRMDIVKIAFNFQLNSLSGVDWFKFYETMNFYEHLTLLQEEYENHTL